MPLHITKVAFGAATVDVLAERLAARGSGGETFLTTRYRPKRAEEIAGSGSLYWIIKHHLVARSPILGFAEDEGGRTIIRIPAALVAVRALPRRAHQGWRYLEGPDAPADLTDLAADGVAALPFRLALELSALALI